MVAKVKPSSPRFIDRAVWDNYRKGSHTISASFDEWGDWNGARKFLEGLGNAPREMSPLGKRTFLDMAKVECRSYDNHHTIVIKGKDNIATFVNWAAKQKNKTVITKLRESHVPGAEYAEEVNATPRDGFSTGFSSQFEMPETPVPEGHDPTQEPLFKVEPLAKIHEDGAFARSKRDGPGTRRARNSDRSPSR